MLRRTIASWILIGLPITAYAQSVAPVDANTTATISTTRAMPSPPIARQWRGFYVGGFIGNAQGDSDLATTTVFSTAGYLPSSTVSSINAAGAQTLETSDTEFGGLAGYNLRFGRVIVGGEGDYSSMRLSGTVTSGNSTVATPFTIQQSIDTKWLATLRLRGGVTFGRTLVYGTFGMAWTDLNYQASFTDTANAHESGGLDNIQSSSVWGAGVEFWCFRNLSVKGEYLSTDFEPASTTSSNLTQGGVSYPMNQFTHSSTLKVRVYRGAVIIRF